MPAIMVSKYNRFVDNILGRVNKILRKSYDPVRVKLQTASKKTKSNKKKNTKRRKSKPSRRTPTGKSLEQEAEPEFILISTTTNDVSNSNYSTTPTSPNEIVTAASTSPPSTSATSTTVQHVTPKTMSTPNGNRSSNTKRRKSNKKTQKNKTKSTEPKARATLFGLASIKRDGDVTVNVMANHRTVRASFLLGPLTLRVEKDFGRGAKKEIRSATATTEEMHGKLNLRIVNGGAATLHSIKVLQPKQVRVDSSDDHDRTREFVWKKSSHIARVVSEKLASATRSMLRPPPKNKK